jgi:hypothetical protein
MRLRVYPVSRQRGAQAFLARSNSPGPCACARPAARWERVVASYSQLSMMTGLPGKAKMRQVRYENPGKGASESRNEQERRSAQRSCIVQPCRCRNRLPMDISAVCGDSGYFQWGVRTLMRRSKNRLPGLSKSAQNCLPESALRQRVGAVAERLKAAVC